MCIHLNLMIFTKIIRGFIRALLEIGSGATLTMQDIDSFEHHGTRTPELTYADSGAKIVNKGTVMTPTY